MKLGGYRTDGTMRVLIPGGVTVLLRGDMASPPMDDREAERDYGPWIEPDTVLTWQERQDLGKRLDRARTVPANSFKALATGGLPYTAVAAGAMLARIDGMARTVAPPKALGQRMDGVLLLGTEGGHTLLYDPILMEATAATVEPWGKDFGEFDCAVTQDADAIASGLRGARVRPNHEFVVPFDLGDRSQYPDGKYPNEQGESSEKKAGDGDDKSRWARFKTAAKKSAVGKGAAWFVSQGQTTDWDKAGAARTESMKAADEETAERFQKALEAGKRNTGNTKFGKR